MDLKATIVKSIIGGEISPRVIIITERPSFTNPDERLGNNVYKNGVSHIPIFRAMT